MTAFIKLVFEQNNLLDGDYCEPYAGGAGIAINLLVHQYASRIHLNDLNPSVYAFWRSVVESPDELCRLVREATLSIAEWNRQKAIQSRPQEHSLLELGFSTFYLNRTNRSGIILGGVIGGKSQDGDWKLGARFNKVDLCRRIETIALYQSRIRLYNLDASQLIKTVIPSLPKKSLVYLDPPYYVKGQHLYENHYRHDDHVKVARLVQSRVNRPWIVSYDYAPEIMDMYGTCPSLIYGINYSAANRYEGSEAMFFSTRLMVPDVVNPANLKVA